MSDFFARFRLRMKLASDRRELLRVQARRLEIQRQTQAHYRAVTGLPAEADETKGPQRRA
jgi:hypothetical protein